MPSSADLKPDRPSPFPWPPVVLACAAACAFVLDRWLLPLPIPFAETRLMQLAGWLLLAIGAGLVAWTALELRHHRTTIRPDRGVRTLVTTGPFAWSRNPIYLGEALALLGVALAFNRLGWALVVPGFVLAVTRLAVVREEAHLERRFGEAYRDWAGRVRRWL